MTTPAQNIDTTTSIPSTYRWYRVNITTGAVTEMGSLPMTKSRRANRKIRPESSSSPVRPDGSRAPKSWSHRWGSMVLPDRLYDIVVGTGNVRNGYSWHGPPVACSLELFMEKVGSNWSRNPSSHPFPQGVESMARTKFRNELSQSIVDWGVTLGEMRQTIRGLSTYAHATIDLVDFLARRVRATRRDVIDVILGIPPRARRTPPWYRGKDRLIIDHWLGYQFGVKPLLVDIYSSAEAVDWLVNFEKRPLRLSIKKGAGAKTIQEVKLLPVNGTGLKGTLLAHRSEQCHISCAYDVEPTTGNTLARLGLTNPVSVGWELITLSWAVDYVTTMGAWLQSLAPIDGADFVEGCITRIQRCDNITSTTLAPNTSDVSVKAGDLDYPLTVIGGRMTREVLYNTPHPGIRPAWKNRLGMTRMANVLAALTNLLR